MKSPFLIGMLFFFLLVLAQLAGNQWGAA